MSLILNDVVLPAPSPDEEDALDRLPSEAHGRIYRFLFDRRDNPPTMVEVIDHSRQLAGITRSQTDRRLRDLRDNFVIVMIRRGKHHTYLLQGMREVPRTSRLRLPDRIKSEVFIHQRCAQCGKTPNDDFVKLEVDHKLPLSWGGNNDIDNLQALCVECNHGKRDFFATMEPFAEQIRHASRETQVHRRIGELMKAFSSADLELPSQVLSVVASIGSYQDDWQKRARELRVLGWGFTIRRATADGRVRSFYTLNSFEEWPHGDVGAEIRRLERENPARARK